MKNHDVCLVGGFNPSKKYQSIGMIIPYIWENKIDVPNHQPVVKANVKLTMKIYLRVSYITGDIPKACSETDFPIDGQITAGFFH